MSGCPFCGGSPEIKQLKQSVDSKGNYAIAWQVACPSCGIAFSATDAIARQNEEVTILYDGRAKAIEMWNTRAEE